MGVRRVLASRAMGQAAPATDAASCERKLSRRNKSRGRSCGRAGLRSHRHDPRGEGPSAARGASVERLGRTCTSIPTRSTSVHGPMGPPGTRRHRGIEILGRDTSFVETRRQSLRSGIRTRLTTKPGCRTTCRNVASPAVVPCRRHTPRPEHRPTKARPGRSRRAASSAPD